MPKAAWRKTAFVPWVYKFVSRSLKLLIIHACLLLEFISRSNVGRCGFPIWHRATLITLYLSEIIFFFASSSYLLNNHTCLFILYVSPLYAAWVPPHPPTPPSPNSLYSIDSPRFSVGLVSGRKKRKQIKRTLNRVYLRIFSVRSVANSDFQNLWAWVHKKILSETQHLYLINKKTNKTQPL